METSASRLLVERFKSCLDSVGATYMNIAVGVLYFLFFLFALISVILLVGNSDKSGPLAFAFVSVLLSAGIHFTMVLGAISIVDGYVLYPVEPRILYASADVAIGLAFGLVTGSYLVDSQATAVPVFGGCMLVIAYGIVLYKVVVVVRGVMHGTRHSKTGELRDKPLALDPLAMKAQNET